MHNNNICFHPKNLCFQNHFIKKNAEKKNESYGITIKKKNTRNGCYSVCYKTMKRIFHKFPDNFNCSFRGERMKNLWDIPNYYHYSFESVKKKLVRNIINNKHAKYICFLFLLSGCAFFNMVSGWVFVYFIISLNILVHFYFVRKYNSVQVLHIAQYQWMNYEQFFFSFRFFLKCCFAIYFYNNLYLLLIFIHMSLWCSTEV